MLDKLIDVLLDALNLFAFWTIVDEFERGVVLTFGKYKGRELGPGLHFVWPFGIDRILVDNVVLRTHDLAPQSLTTRDGKSIAVKGVVSLCIRDVKKALLDVENVDNAMVDSCCAAIAAHVAETEWASLTGEPANEALTKACRRQAWRYGIEIVRVQLADLTPCKSLRLLTRR